jgi:hypothetical protein
VSTPGCDRCGCANALRFTVVLNMRAEVGCRLRTLMLESTRVTAALKWKQLPIHTMSELQMAVTRRTRTSDRCALFYDFTAFRKRDYVDDRAIHPRRAEHAAAA